MAIGAGHSKTVTDGLIFGYDTGDKRNSFKGKDTTNLLTNIGYNYGTQDSALFKTNYGTETVNIPAIGEVTTHYVNIYNDYNGGSGQCCLSLFGFGNCAVSPSTVYTYQIIYKTTTGYSHPNYMYHYEYGPGGYVTEYGLHSTSREVDLGDGWKMGWGTFTTNANTNNTTCYLFHYEYGTYNKIQLAGIMLTQGSVVYDPLHFLPVQGIRSSANILRNLIPNVFTVDTNTVSYTTEPTPGGDMVFDGTNDSMTTNLTGDIYCLEMVWYNNNAIPDNESVIGGPSTYQTPISFNGTNAGVHLGSWTGGLSNEAIHIWYGGGATSTKTGRPVGYHHVLFNWNGSSYDIWVDGDKEITYPLSGTTHASRIQATSATIGTDTNNYFFNGRIPVVRAYNRSLTDTEIIGNANLYRSRYRIPDIFRYYEGTNAALYLNNWDNSTTYTMADFGGIPNVTAHGWQYGPATYTLTLTDLPPHSHVRYKVYWHLVDSLDNETNQLFIGFPGSETEILRFSKVYNTTPSISVQNAKTSAVWSGPKTYTYRPWANGTYNQDGYLLIDSGWIGYSNSTFTARHVMGADQVQADEAMYLSHVEVLVRY